MSGKETGKKLLQEVLCLYFIRSTSTRSIYEVGYLMICTLVWTNVLKTDDGANYVFVPIRIVILLPLHFQLCDFAIVIQTKACDTRYHHVRMGRCGIVAPNFITPSVSNYLTPLTFYHMFDCSSYSKIFVKYVKLYVYI